MLHIAIRSLVTCRSVSLVGLTIPRKPSSLFTVTRSNLRTRSLSSIAKGFRYSSIEAARAGGTSRSSKKRQRQRANKNRDINVQVTRKSAKTSNSANQGAGSSEAKATQPSGSAAAPHQLNHGALDAFFKRYRKNGFEYRPGALPPERGAKWEIMRKDLKKKFARAMNEEFGLMFGKDIDDLVAWHKLCTRIGIKPLPTTSEAARREVKRCNVNIVELMTKSIPDGSMPRFKTEKDLALYTIRSWRRLVYPRDLVEKGDILEDLLRHMDTFALEPNTP